MANISIHASGIYCIKNIITGRSYVGSAVNMQARLRRHKRSLKNGSHHSVLLQKAWGKYGPDTFEFFALEEVSEIADLLQREQVWIDRLSSHDERSGFNICRFAGSPLGRKHSPESRAKMSLAKKGKALSPQHKASIGSAHLGKTHPPEWRANIGAGNKGKTLSDDHKAILRALYLGKTRPKSHCDAISRGQMGAKQSQEARENMKISWKQRPSHSEIEFNGETLGLQEWATRTGIRYGTLYRRIKILKWPVDKALDPHDHRLPRHGL